MRLWTLASPYGILREGDAADPDPAWNAGHLNDALRLKLPSYGRPNPLLVASATSGVWIVNERGDPAIPLGKDWEAPRVNCLARGFYAEAHVFAGGDALYETDMTQPDPLRAWRRIALVDAADHPANTGQIFRIVIAPWHALHIVAPWRRAIVLATETGVWWSGLPATPGALAHLVVTKAVFLPGAMIIPPLPLAPVPAPPFPDTPVTGLALNADDQVVAACWGSDFDRAYGIFVGDWTGPGNSLEFAKRAMIHGIDARQMLRTELAASRRHPNRMYAVCGGGFTTPARGDLGKTILDPRGQGGIKWEGDDFILAVLHSTDGGHSWAPTPAVVNGIATSGDDPPPLFPGSPTADLAGHTQEGYNLCIGVSPFHDEVLAIGVVSVFLSQDGGATWDAYPSDTSRHRHADTHACYFDPLTQGTLHVCSDGGLATTPDMGTTWSSIANRQLPNLQCRRFSVSAHDDGLLAGSLQDNGDVAAPLYPDADPWRTLPYDRGDGILSLFASTGALIHHNNDEISHRSHGYKPRAAVWDGVARQFADLHMFPPDSQLWYGVIPADGMRDGLTSNMQVVYLGGMKRRGYLNLVEAVTTPTGANAAGEVMQAVAAEGPEEVHGLYPKVDGTFHWQYLGNVPYRPSIDPASPTHNTLPFYATASASLDGNSVLVGMNTGKLLRLDAPTGATTEMWTATELSNPAIPVTAAITRIVPVAADSVFVIAGAGCHHWDGASWKALSVPSAAGDPFMALAADFSTAPDPPRLFIATTNGVWKSEDNGATWAPDMLDLPKVPMAWDLRTVTESSGAAFVYLATYGWSVFRRLTNAEDMQQHLTIDGHMDIISRTVTGHDITGHPPFNRTATLGPLRPKVEWTITGDAGDAVRVIVNLRCAWKIDQSIHVTYHAELIDLDDDNDMSDHEDGVVMVPFGATVPLAFSMDSDELWPDRGYVECTIANL